MDSHDSNNMELVTRPEKVVFLSPQDKHRLEEYTFNEKMFMGEHFDAFNMKISDFRYNEAYAKIRYVMVNFAGLVSKVCADMLFGEPVKIRADGGDQEFIDLIWKSNKMDTQVYESALSNSYYGDAVFKIRADYRAANDENLTLIIDDTTPRIYFPVYDAFNVKGDPKSQELAWIFKQGKEEYLRKEIHTPGKITNELFLMKGNEIVRPVDLGLLGIDGLEPEVDTGIDRSLLIHIPNWKSGNRWSGISDYYDLVSLFYAMNNRFAAIDNILDKHSDPILMVPEGVIDENGKVRKDGRVIEVREGENGKPEYIVWDASLDNAFKEIEKLAEMLFMVSEVSPDILGMGKGQSDSGRALKYKLLRTIAKVNRKKRYYMEGLKQLLYNAQLFAKANNLSIDGKTLQGNPVVPEIEFQDGIPLDISEAIENETKAIDAGITTKKNAIMRVYQIDEKAAEQELKDIKDETAVELPEMNMAVDAEGMPMKPIAKQQPPAAQ